MTNFFQTIIQGLLLGGVYALAASGLTLVFGVMNVINVAHGALLILAAYITWQLWLHAGIDPLLAILITTPTMFAIGWLIYRLTIQRIRDAPASMSVLLTFAIALIIEGGIGSLAGATIGALLIGTGETLTTAYISPQWQTAVAYVVIFAVLLLRPQGLLGSRTREDVATA